MFRALSKEQAMADRLRREAFASRPAFSEDLHSRLCEAIRQSRTDAARPCQSASTARRLLHWMPAAAAACLLTVFYAGWTLTRTVPDAGSVGSDSTQIARTGAPGVAIGKRKVDMQNMSELVGQVTTGVDSVVRMAARAPRWACLDRNIRRALETPVVGVPCDVVSSLLSLAPSKRSRVPAGGHTLLQKRNLIQGQARVQDG